MNQRSSDLGRLGLGPEATTPEIVAAFRVHAFTAHPDQGGSEATMVELTEIRDRLLLEPSRLATAARADHVVATADDDVDRVRAGVYLVPMVLMPAVLLLLLVVIAGAI